MDDILDKAMPKKVDSSRVVISNDKMSATLYLAPKPVEADYTVSEIVEILHSFGVVKGIDFDAIETVIKKRMYMLPCCVARGTPAADGTDGFFTYNFRTVIDNRPTILPDGSVDYRTKDIYEPVHEGDTVATYTPPTQGTDGANVLGVIIPHKPGHDLSSLKGNGFTLSDDKLTYTSLMDGKIELNGDMIIISNVLDVQSDVDISYGDIDFNGNVYIRGGVLHGATIRATGDIVVCGNVEDAFLFSKQNIELKSGMTGMGRGYIECNGTLYGKFFENSIIKVQGDLNANSMMNCNTVVRGRAYISGRHGVIVGGTTNALLGLTATTIGNLAELKTYVSVGINPEFMEQIHSIEKLIEQIKERIGKIDIVLTKIMMIRNPADKNKLTQKREQAEYSKNELMRQCTSLVTERSKMIAEAKSTSYACITVNKYLFPRVVICINGLTTETKINYTNVTIKAGNEQIEIVNNI